MKKSDYVTKYDYINYYVKQPSMWFFTNSELKAAYDIQMKTYQAKNGSLNNISNDIVDDEDDEENDNEGVDAYSLYRETLDELSELDDKNPLIVSGRIIDQEVKKFIISYHNDKYRENFLVHDFDNEKLSLKQNAEKVKSLIETNKHLILFQPVFIDTKRKILTKCDALVKYENELYLIETKATSTAKFHHILDLFFQKQVLEENLSPQTYDINYQLCLIKYEYLDAYKVSFIISDTINLAKSVGIPNNIPDNELMDIKQKIKLGDGYTSTSKNTDKPIGKDALYINDVLDLTSDFISHKTLNSNRVKTNKIEIMTAVRDNFDEVIKQLWLVKTKLENHPKDMPEIFFPHANDKSVFKNTDMWLELRNLYAIMGFNQFLYSGNVINQSPENLTTFTDNFLNKKSINLSEFIRVTDPDKKQKISSLFFNSNDDFFINDKECKELLNKLKAKRVYFDFESINPGIRVINNSLPFMQVVTQCSVIVADDTNPDLNCDNLMCDPQNITSSFFKEIVDSLYRGADYSYIVYNKTFEENRLKEMDRFIGEEEYSLKINIINKNIFDLADFFKVSAVKQVVFIKELGGFYSIKKVLPLVEKYAKEIFKETKCADYHDLDISNGVECQNKSLLRFYRALDDDEWAIVVENSKIYCENDVRAMIAVLYWVVNRLNNSPTIPHYSVV